MKFRDAGMCSVSMQHIIEKDNELLLEVAAFRDFQRLIVYTKEDGFFVFVSDEDIGEELQAAGFSQNFIDLLDKAREEKWWWMLLDAGEKPTPGLPVFEW